MILYPSPSDSTYTLQVRYFQRPSQVVASTDCAQVTSVTTGGGNFTINVAALPSTISAGNVPVDFVGAVPGFDVAGSYTPTGHTSTSLTFSGTPPSVLVTGTWVCASGTAPLFTMIPAELYPLTCQLVAVERLAMKGEGPRLETAESTLERLDAEAKVFLGQRVKSGHRKLNAGAMGSRYPWIRRFIIGR